MLLAEDSPINTSGVWGVIAVLVAGVLALAGDWVRRRWNDRKNDEPSTGEPSERIAADLASREILTWADQHVIAPLRRQLGEMSERIQELQTQLDAREAELAEARATIRELQQQLIFLERQLTERQGQIAVLLSQLGVRHDEPPSGRAAHGGHGSAARVRPEPSGAARDEDSPAGSVTDP